MNFMLKSALIRAALVAGAAVVAAGAAKAQMPPPIVVDTAVPIIINTVAAVVHKGSQSPRFEGTFVNATVAQITVRSKGNEMAIQTFTLTPEASAKMLDIINKGGYQYGDKVTVILDSEAKKAVGFKGKPSKPS